MQQNKGVHVHSLNTSPGKQRYSFSKGSRFQYDKPKTDAYYMPSLDRDRRSALIGCGERSLGIINNDRNLKQVPHSYDLPSSMEIKKGNAFHGGRYEIGGYLGREKILSALPSPQNYSIPSTLQQRGASLKSKLPDFSLKEVNKVPGPGAYSVPSSLKTEDKGLMDSKFTTPSGIKIHNSMDISRRREPVTYVPGPGQYDMQKYGIGNPENPYSQNQNTRFSRGDRDSVGVKGAQKLPGPGAYKAYSQFD